jgi:hypothetical protein
VLPGCDAQLCDECASRNKVNKKQTFDLVRGENSPPYRPTIPAIAADKHHIINQLQSLFPFSIILLSSWRRP